jgi:exopolyphosphatase/guanosine-5'-triphosphate,3'-diphosphate pyrophosphatase
MTTSDIQSQGRLGVMDLGSNTVLLLVVEPDGRVVEDVSRITRLGQGVFGSGELHPDAIARTRDAVAELAARARALGARRVVGVGTEALRRARGGSALLEEWRRAGMLDTARVLSGDEEAACAIEASRRALDGAGEVIVIDVGGGSTEVAWTQGREPSTGAPRVRGISLPLGSVRMTEALLPRHPVPEADLARLEAELERGTQPLAALRAHGLDAAGRAVVAVAGTATTLAAMDLELERYDAARVEGHRLPLERVSHWIERLARLSVEERRRVPGLEPGRADVIVAGLAVLRAALRAIGARELRASGRGVRHGVALRLLEDPAFLR